MRFMILRKADPSTEAGAMPSEELCTQMGNFIEESVKAGIFLSGEGLHPSSRGARVSFSEGVPEVMDGPFTEVKELIAGVTILEVPSLEAAVEWAKRWPTVDGDGNVQIEIRRMYEASDFAEPSNAEPPEGEARFREVLEKHGRPMGANA